MKKIDGHKDNYWTLITKILGDEWEIEWVVKDDEYYFVKQNDSYCEKIDYNKYYFIYVFRKNDYTELILQISKENWEFTEFLEQVKKIGEK